METPEREAPSGEAVVVAEVTDEPLAGAWLLSRLGAGEDGAAVVFEGRVRSRNEGREVTRLHYEAYREMADQVLDEIARDAATRFAVTHIGLCHRIGSLAVGEVSLVVGVAAPHREPALDAMRYVIERIKARLPVWKKEEYADGESRWLEAGSAPAAHDAATEDRWG